ncbi:MAG: hypothetical protein NXI24_07360 [bacterium]|nr:hypothetical protein [bacterium]
MSKTKTKQEGTRYRFRAEDFWSLIKAQEYKCALTGRELTPENTEVELKDPSRVEGRGEPDNLYLVVRSLAHMARYEKEREIIELAAEIVANRGGEYGYGLKRTRKGK